MKSNEEAMEILEAFDLVQSFEAAAELAGCDPKTVKHYVQMRDRVSELINEPRRDRMINKHMDKVEEWVERSKGRIRADIVHLKLKAMDFEGSERTTRRAVHEVKDAYAKGNRRIYRPWIPEPGMWFQFDWGDGPDIAGRETSLWCAWLAWSRFRVVIPTWDRKLPTVIACIDETLRLFGGVPTYALTDNEKTVTIDRVATIPVRHPPSWQRDATTGSVYEPASLTIPRARAALRPRSRSQRQTWSQPTPTCFLLTRRSTICEWPAEISWARSTIVLTRKPAGRPRR